VTNRINQTGHLRLLTVQIGWDDTRDNRSNGSQDPSPYLKFEYITEVAPKISNFQADKMKPGYMTVLKSTQDSSFYIYTGIGKHSVVF
jgi:hypothetical protein